MLLNTSNRILSPCQLPFPSYRAGFLLLITASLLQGVNLGCTCNRVHLHIVFVLLYVLCVSLCRCSFVCTSFDLLRMWYVLWFRRHYETHYKSEWEKARGNNNDLSYVPSKRKEEIKSGTSGCGSFVVPYFQPATFTDHLHPHTHPTSTPSILPFDLPAQAGWVEWVAR